MTEKAQISRVRIIVYVVALSFIMIGFGVMLYTMINIQNLQNVLNDPNLNQQARWAAEGSLQWWQNESTVLYYPVAALLIVLGITAVLYAVVVR